MTNVKGAVVVACREVALNNVWRLVTSGNESTVRTSYLYVDK
jgi:hypothetical protein